MRNALGFPVSVMIVLASAMTFANPEKPALTPAPGLGLSTEALVNEASIDAHINDPKNTDLLKKPVTTEETETLAKDIVAGGEKNQVDLSKLPAGERMNTTSPVWDELVKASPNMPRAPQKAPDRYEGIDVFAAVSLSLPPGDLEAMFYEASRLKQEKNLNVLFVFRGFEPKKYGAFINAVQDRVPNDLNEAPAIAVDPTVFQTLGITKVPTFAVKTTDHNGDGTAVWRAIIGNVKLEMAINEADKGIQAPVMGATYDIAEPDVLAYMMNRLKTIDWEAEALNAQKRALRSRYGINLETSAEGQTYYVDPSYTLARDIVMAGNVMGRAGDKINPLSAITMRYRYVIFDASNPAEVAAVAHLRREGKEPRYISPHMPSTLADYEMVSASLGQFFELDPLLKERLGVKYTPSIIEQEGLQLKVTVLPAPTQEEEPQHEGQ